MTPDFPIAHQTLTFGLCWFFFMKFSRIYIYWQFYLLTAAPHLGETGLHHSSPPSCFHSIHKVQVFLVQNSGVGSNRLHSVIAPRLTCMCGNAIPHAKFISVRLLIPCADERVRACPTWTLQHRFSDPFSILWSTDVHSVFWLLRFCFYYWTFCTKIVHPMQDCITSRSRVILMHIEFEAKLAPNCCHLPR